MILLLLVYKYKQNYPKFSMMYYFLFYLLTYYDLGYCKIA